jgi:hypothetical protein
VYECAFGCSLTAAADAGPGSVDVLAVCEVLLEIFLLRLFTPWKSSSWADDPVVAVELLRSCLLPQPIPSNGCFIVACFTVVA